MITEEKILTLTNIYLNSLKKTVNLFMSILIGSLDRKATMEKVKAQNSVLVLIEIIIGCTVHLKINMHLRSATVSCHLESQKQMHVVCDRYTTKIKGVNSC